MLFHIAMTDNDQVFNNCLDACKKALFSEEDYNTPENIRQLPDWNYTDRPEEEQQLSIINDSLHDIIQSTCFDNGGKYLVKGSDESKMPLPFIERYHSFFLQRKWNKPVRDPRSPANAAELFRLPKLANNENPDNDQQNYSKNVGDYNHFLNVIAAMARLIKHLETPGHLCALICPNNDKTEKLGQYAKEMSFNPETQGMRIFTLMLAAFFHDIGKTIVYHRHGMEGAIIISEHTSQSWYQLNRIAKQYNFPENFERNDLMYISDMLDFHDQFGTLSTGEAGSIQFIDLIQRIKRRSLKYKNKEEQQKWSRRYLFDLWLLNIADIMVSVENKWGLQKEWDQKESSKNKINNFLTAHHGKISTLTHDLRIANKLITTINEHRHTDIYIKLQERSQSYSYRHTVERIRRLIYSCIELSVNKAQSKNESAKFKNISGIIQYLTVEHSLSEAEITAAIVRSINATRSFSNFCERFSWIGQMDYALGFFESICSRALERINKELKDTSQQTHHPSFEEKRDYCFQTKWIRDKFSSSFGDTEEDRNQSDKLQSELFVDNFTITVINLIDHLLFREESITRVKNIEFNETRDRLTNEKIDTIISLDGPYQAKRAIQLILKTVFIY